MNREERSTGVQAICACCLPIQLTVYCRQRNKEKFESLQQEVETLTSSLQHLEMEKQKLETETSMLRAQQQKAGTSGSTQPSVLLGLKKVATPAEAVTHADRCLRGVHLTASVKVPGNHCKLGTRTACIVNSLDVWTT